jgi:hypothetical protein
MHHKPAFVLVLVHSALCFAFQSSRFSTEICILRASLCNLTTSITMSEFPPLRSNPLEREEREGISTAQINGPSASNLQAFSGGESPKDYWGVAFRRLNRMQQDRIKRALGKEETHEGNGSDDSDDGEEINPRVLDRLIITDGSPSWPDVLSEICRQQQEGHTKKSWKFRFAGRDVDLRKKLENWVNFFDRIKQIGDVAVNVDPLHAGLPWAVIRLIITVRKPGNICPITPCC